MALSSSCKEYVCAECEFDLLALNGTIIVKPVRSDDVSCVEQEFDALMCEGVEVHVRIYYPCSCRGTW